MFKVKGKNVRLKTLSRPECFASAVFVLVPSLKKKSEKSKGFKVFGSLRFKEPL